MGVFKKAAQKIPIAPFFAKREISKMKMTWADLVEQTGRHRGRHKVPN